MLLMSSGIVALYSLYTVSYLFMVMHNPTSLNIAPIIYAFQDYFTPKLI